VPDPACPHDRTAVPVVAADGHTYGLDAIGKWLVFSSKSPVTNKPLAHTHLAVNHTLRKIMFEWVAAHISRTTRIHGCRNGPQSHRRQEKDAPCWQEAQGDCAERCLCCLRRTLATLRSCRRTHSCSTMLLQRAMRGRVVCATMRRSRMRSRGVGSAALLPSLSRGH
jgi:hypothetical protein